MGVDRFSFVDRIRCCFEFSMFDAEIGDRSDVRSAE